MADCNITLDIFVNTLFPDLDEHERVCFARPATKGYHQRAYSPRLAQSVIDRPAAWYVCVSSVKAVPTNKMLRRRAVDCLYAWVLILDDIGTIVPFDKAPDIPPSVILESSKDNYQWLYLLEPWDLTTPESLDYFEDCHRAIVNAGYGDTGGPGGVTKVFRVPGSINTKEGKNNWVTRVTGWHPELIYDLPDIMTALKLKPETKAVRGVQAAAPAGLIDPVATWLESRDLLGEEDDAFFTIRCPWAGDHTDDQISAGYSPLGHGLHPLYRVFNCFHAHCANRGAEHFLAWITEQGGPRARVSGVSEVEVEQLNDFVEALSPLERSELLRHSLPPVRKSDLFDTEKTPIGLYAKAQPVTGANVARVADVLGVIVQRNMQTHEMECEFLDDSLAALVDNANAEALSVLFDHCDLVGMKNARAIGDRITLMSDRVKYSPVCEWVRSTRWDEVSRFEDLVATVPVAPPFKQVWPVYLRHWLIQTMQAMHNWQGEAKAIEHVLVLCSRAQGTGKTTWVERLLPHGMVSVGVQLHLGKGGVSNDRDGIRQATRTPIAELGELETTFSKTATGRLRSYLSNRMDTYRMAYGTTEVDFPRTTSYAGTVNQIDFIVDSTGSRRFWPVELIPGKRCDIYHEINMQQLWAEVYTWWRAGERYALNSEENRMRKSTTRKFTFVTPIAELVAQYLARHSGVTEPMNTTTFLNERLHVHINNINKRQCTAALEAALGPSDLIQKVRNAWAIPMLDQPPARLTLVEDKDKG